MASMHPTHTPLVLGLSLPLPPFPPLEKERLPCLFLGCLEGGDERIEAKHPTGARNSGATPAWPPPACPPSLRVSLLSGKECGQTVSDEVGVMNPQENGTGALETKLITGHWLCTASLSEPQPLASQMGITVVLLSREVKVQRRLT